MFACLFHFHSSRTTTKSSLITSPLNALIRNFSILVWIILLLGSTGACEGSVACSTCHVILTPEHYDQLPEPDDDENDMLDMAFGLTDTSRLGCQVKLTKDLDGMVATLPSATRNMFVDGKWSVLDKGRSILLTNSGSIPAGKKPTKHWSEAAARKKLRIL